MSMSENVTPMTTSQLCAAWWVNRSLSQTSKSSCDQVCILAKSIDENHELRGDFELIGAYGKFTKLLPDLTEGNAELDDDEDDVDSSLEFDPDVRLCFKYLLKILEEE